MYVVRDRQAFLTLLQTRSLGVTHDIMLLTPGAVWPRGAGRCAAPVHQRVGVIHAEYRAVVPRHGTHHLTRRGAGRVEK